MCIMVCCRTHCRSWHNWVTAQMTGGTPTGANMGESSKGEAAEIKAKHSACDSLQCPTF